VRFHLAAASIFTKANKKFPLTSAYFDFFIRQHNKVLQGMLEDSPFVISLFRDTEKTEVLPVIHESGIPCDLLHSLLSTNESMTAKLCISSATNFN